MPGGVSAAGPPTVHVYVTAPEPALNKRRHVRLPGAADDSALLTVPTSTQHAATLNVCSWHPAAGRYLALLTAVASTSVACVVGWQSTDIFQHKSGCWLVQTGPHWSQVHPQ
jgi:hypothetical protein